MTRSLLGRLLSPRPCTSLTLMRSRCGDCSGNSGRGLTGPPSGLSLEPSQRDCGKNAHCNRRPARYVAAQKEALCRGDSCNVVEVRRGGVDFVAAMAQMRTWFDNQGIQPSLFEIAFLPGRESRFRLQFKEVRDAVTFASSFDGEVLDTGLDAAAA